MTTRDERAQALKDDAVSRGYGPGALVLRLNGSEVLVTSWPWLDGEDDEECAMIMARTEEDNPATNRRMMYYGLARKIGERPL